jgi:hypothetical protein
VPTDTYATFNGTSMATPHVSGCIALMLSVAPMLDYDQIYDILTTTAEDLGAAGFDYDFGHGRIDCYEAVLEAQILAGPTGTLEGMVTEDGSGTPLAGALIEATLNVTTTRTALTDASGQYIMTFVPEGTYDVTASLFGYLPQTVSGVDIISGTVTTQDFSLELAPSHTVSGIVTDANTGWPLYASIEVGGADIPTVWTDPVDGSYSVLLPEDITYTLNVNAWVAGYESESRDIGPLTDDVTEDFGLDVDATSCMAPGYSLSYHYFEDFQADDGNYTLSGPAPAPWQWGEPVTWPGECASGSNCWGTNLSGYYYASADETLTSPVIDLSGITPGEQLTARWYQANHIETFTWDKAYAEVSIDGGAWQVMWQNPTSTVQEDWRELAYDISAAAGNDVQFRWRFTSDVSVNYAGLYVDRVAIVEGVDCQLEAGSLVVGNVYDANNSGALSGAEVVNDSGYTATAVDTPDDPAVDDAFYTIFAPAGSNVLTATYTSAYGSDTAMLTVGDGDTVHQVFWLPTDWLQANPDILVINVLTGTMATVPLNLNNVGGMDVDFQIQELPGGYTLAMSVADRSQATDIGDEWETMAPLPAGRVFNTVVADQNGYVYVIGGTSDAGGAVPTNTNYRYDTATNTWDTMEPMPASLMSPNGVEVNNKIYIPGDSTTATTYVYDIATDTWSDIPANGGYTARSQYQIVAIGTDVYVLGGIVAAAGASTTEIWQLDTNSDTWAAGVPMQNSRTSFSAAAINGEIYVAGGVAFPGFAPDMTAEKFDGDNWSYIAGVPDDGGSYTRWSYNAAGHGADGLWLAAGRRDAAWTVLNHAGYYNPDTDAWTDSPDVPALSQGRVYMEGAVATDGYFYVIGGRDSAGAVIYDNNERLHVGAPAVGDVVWLSQDPESGTVAAGDDFDVQITFTTFPTMPLGIYTATLRIQNSTVYGPIDVPVTMRVYETYHLWLPFVYKP